ncbi:MAG: 30S ribosomal protein S12 methylthiotransferase RimO, partial [Phycisphaerae bacterium]
MGRGCRAMGNGCEGPKLAFVALGCPKNLVDSERMLADLGQDGFVLTSDARQAEVIVVNTCGFLAAARQEA